jgi:hypothetical protein
MTFLVKFPAVCHEKNMLSHVTKLHCHPAIRVEVGVGVGGVVLPCRLYIKVIRQLILHQQVSVNNTTTTS